MSPLFPTPIPHTPPAHCVRVHLLIAAEDEEEKKAERAKKALELQASRLSWMADAGPLTTREIGERINRTHQAAYYLLMMLHDAGIVRATDERPIRWEWIGVAE